MTNFEKTLIIAYRDSMKLISYLMKLLNNKGVDPMRHPRFPETLNQLKRLNDTILMKEREELNNVVKFTSKKKIPNENKSLFFPTEKIKELRKKRQEEIRKQNESIIRKLGLKKKK